MALAVVPIRGLIGDVDHRFTRLRRTRTTDPGEREPDTEPSSDLLQADEAAPQREQDQAAHDGRRIECHQHDSENQRDEERPDAGTAALGDLAGPDVADAGPIPGLQILDLHAHSG